MLTFIIDPGHGGSDPGAVANGYKEKDLTLETSFNLKAELERCGTTAIMTRTEDIDVELTARGKLALDNKANAIISIHFNSFSDLNAHGAEVLYSFLEECRASSQWIAECILEEAIKLGMYKRGTWTKESGTTLGRNYFGMLRGAEPVAGVICEGLFITNAGDIQLLKTAGFLKNLAKAYAKGICRSYGIQYIEENTNPMPAPYKDWDRVSDYAQEAVLALQKAGIMVGGDGFFKPRDQISRQDMAVVIYNTLKRSNLI